MQIQGKRNTAHGQRDWRPPGWHVASGAPSTDRLGRKSNCQPWSVLGPAGSTNCNHDHPQKQCTRPGPHGWSPPPIWHLLPEWDQLMMWSVAGSSTSSHDLRRNGGTAPPLPELSSFCLLPRPLILECPWAAPYIIMVLLSDPASAGTPCSAHSQACCLSSRVHWPLCAPGLGNRFSSCSLCARPGGAGHTPGWASSRRSLPFQKTLASPALAGPHKQRPRLSTLNLCHA